MKILFIGVFILGMVVGVWSTGQSVAFSNVVSQECSVKNDSRIVILGNLKLTNPLGGLTCNKEALDKAGDTVSQGVEQVNAGLDQANANLETGNGLYSKSDFDFTRGG